MNSQSNTGTHQPPICIDEGRLRFTFVSSSIATTYDTWTFYRKHFLKVHDGLKGVDILCVSGTTLWLIEVKDYRVNRRTKPSQLDEELAGKVVSTLAALSAAAVNANVEQERDFSRRSRMVDTIKVVLHLEQPQKGSKLFPQIIDPSILVMKLKRRLKAIDPHPGIATMRSPFSGANWTVTPA